MYLAKYTEKILKFTEAEQGLEGVNSSCKNVDRFFFFSNKWLWWLCVFIVWVGESLPLSSGNQITVRFTSVGPITAKGFHFVYQGEAT